MVCVGYIAVTPQLMHERIWRGGVHYTHVLLCLVTSGCPISHQLFPARPPSAGDAWIFVSILEIFCLYFCYPSLASPNMCVHFPPFLGVCTVRDVVLYISDPFLAVPLNAVCLALAPVGCPFVGGSTYRPMSLVIPSVPDLIVHVHYRSVLTASAPSCPCLFCPL